jgi:hypothetical protein
MRRFCAYATIAITVILLCSAAAQAQTSSNRTFVSGQGSDTNPCTNIAPCRSFAAAVLVTNPGGEVTMLDPAGYGAVTITKAISIVNDGGGEAGINDPGASQDAITINAGAGDVVNLRGLTLNGVGTGNNGITFNSGGALNIQNCVIRDFSNDGVLTVPTGSADVTIADTIVSNNFVGIEITAGGTGVTVIAALARIAAIGNTTNGFFLQANSGNTLRGTIVDSVATGGVGNGVSVHTTGTTVTLVNLKTVNNNVGLEVDTGSTAYISETTVAGNRAAGFLDTSGAIKTFGDNYIIDTNNSGSLTPAAEQ